ncbi:NAD(P)/FAD-dependent oxidoreductase [Nakamurella lactea]|uniref:NAD(P)/FAD-dependent oxidoreductase n=1 Tax=Nakamurella lactea TaxID=459515 RepID=UPI00048C71C5
MPPSVRPSVAVVGSGISGLTAAYLLRKTHRVVLFEADDRLGGHAHTHRTVDDNGKPLAVDSGFIVHNDRTYPLLRRLLGELDVPVRRAEMSMSIRHEASGLEYAGGRGIRGLAAQPQQLLSRRFLCLLAQVRRFHRSATQFLCDADEGDDTSYGEFLARQHFSAEFCELYAVPVVACVWSCGSGKATEYPARFLFRFLDHHGMLSIGHSPQWYTIPGGSGRYVDALAAQLADVRRGHKVTAVQRRERAASVTDGTGTVTDFDKVVLATHADQALSLLADPTAAEHQVLGALGYSTNHTVLHTDSSLLPRARGARASWNYLVPSHGDPADGPVVTYWMNRLQGLPGERQFLVTLNAADRIDPVSVIARMEYRHPVYDVPSAGARARLPELNTPVTAFAGAYHGWGFHEDGCRSGVAAAAAFGVNW